MNSAIESIRRRWPIPTLEERVEQALDQPVLAAERAYRIQRYVPIALAFLIAQVIGNVAALEFGVLLVVWIVMWVGLRVSGIFAVLAVTETDVVILHGIAGSLHPKVFEEFVPNLDKLKRPPQRIKVGGRAYRLTQSAWRAVLPALTRTGS